MIILQTFAMKLYYVIGKFKIILYRYVINDYSRGMIIPAITGYKNRTY